VGDAVLLITPPITRKVFKVGKLGQHGVFFQFLLVEIIRNNQGFGDVFCRFCRRDS
jgi:hypothetical protein